MKPMPIDIARAFAAGAASALPANTPPAYIKGFVDCMYKAAAIDPSILFARAQDNEEEDSDSFWSRNKDWLIPALVGTGAFWLGGAAGRGRPDRNLLQNLGHMIGSGFDIISGKPTGPVSKNL